MPEQKVIKRARRDASEGKSASTQAGEFVREQIHRIREGKHGARSAKQAIAIGLSEARRAGVPLKAPRGKGKGVKEKAEQDISAGKRQKRPSPTRSRATLKALKKEGGAAASHQALSRQARQSARKRGPAARSAASKKAAATRRRKES